MADWGRAAPARVTVIGVQPASLDMGLEPTPLIAERLDEMVAMVADELAAIGLSPSRWLI